ncbi:MAG TPA: toll/interleukin-1 receptor domain-containing protein, partial [Longimicrobium sp.]|nr:toll/interleukin-1 receptor domain-containing protein [Longimicrobium sp.]
MTKGAAAWNRWRVVHPHLRPDLSGADLRGARLAHFRLHHVNLAGCDLTGASLAGADLRGASLRESVLDHTTLTGADLGGAELVRARMTGAVLAGAVLVGANLTGAELQGADLDGAVLHETVFNGSGLTGARNLDRCIHEGPSYLDARTFARSRGLPAVFLRGCGLPQAEIERYPLYEPGLDAAGAAAVRERVRTAAGGGKAYPSCFISYSSRDDRFARKLYGDLVNAGIYCWWAAEDMRIGDSISDVILTEIGMRDKLLLVLSAHSVESAWVKREVRRATAGNRAGVLVPIRIDDAVLRSS